MNRMLWSAALAVALVGGCAKDEGKRAAVADAARGSARHGAGFVAGANGHRVARPLTPPLYFEPNVGQTDAQARFLARGPGFQLFLTSTGPVFKLAASVLCTETPCASKAARTSDLVRMAFAGANPDPVIEGLEPQREKSHYFIGNDPSRWHRNVAGYAKVRYRGVYPGVDVVFYGKGQALEYDFVVAPHADTGAIAFDLGGVRDVRVDRAGNLLMKTSHGELQQHRPAVYQDIGGRRVAVDGRYAVLGNGRVGFALGAHDASAPLVIDPMFGFSTYLGGGGYDVANAVAVDADGNTYVAGTTGSVDFVAGQVHELPNNSSNAYVRKYDADGNIVYTTYLAGTLGSDEAHAVAVDGAGRVYVAGQAFSTDFPVLDAVQDTMAGMGDVFVTRLAPDGSTLEYSTYIGGSRQEPFDGNDALGGTPWSRTRLAVDAAGSAYITGGTSSLDFPVHNALQAVHGVDPDQLEEPDAFLVKLSPDGRSVVYATYLGGSRADSGSGIAVDAGGNAYVVGRTASPDFPVAAAMQGSKAGVAGSDDAFVAEVNADGSALVYSTFLGGTAWDKANAVAIDADGNAYVAGVTESAGFPFSAYPATDCTPVDPLTHAYTAFVAKVAAAGQSLAYSACLPSATPLAIAVDAGGYAHLTGYTNAPDFPTVDPMQAHLSLQVSQGNAYPLDAFVSTLMPDGGSLLFSTYLGGNYNDLGKAIAVDAAGTLHIAGDTSATDFPTTNGSYSTESPDMLAGNGFVATIQDGIELSVADFRLVEGNDTHQATFNVHLSSASSEPVTFDLDTVDLGPGEAWATEGVDYEGVHARGLVFAPGETDKAITMTIYGDTTPETGGSSVYPSEAFLVMPSNVVGATLRDLSATALIGNDDTVISIGDMAAPEGTGLWQTYDMPIMLSAGVVVPVSFDYTVTQGSANGSDYLVSTPHRITLSPGMSGTSVGITVNPDATIEPDETIHVELSNVAGATVGQSAATFTILNDDTSLSIADTSVVEGNSGTKMAVFKVSIAQPTVVPVTFDAATKYGSAVANSDYVPTILKGVTIPAGSTSTTVSVPVVGDTTPEGAETFQLLLSNVHGATVTDGAASCIIRNDDTRLSIADVSATEGYSGTKAVTFTVRISNVSALPVTFNMSTANKTAIAGSDYYARTLSGLSIPAGSNSRSFTIGLVGDRAVEANETFLVNVSGVKNAVVADAQAVGTIRNDDAVLSIADASTVEGNSGTRNLAFTVKLSAPLPVPMTLSVATANKTATAGSDYVALSLTGQSIPAGVTSKVFNVAIKGDTVREASETFLVNVPSVSVGGYASVTVGDAQALGTIINDD